MNMERSSLPKAGCWSLLAGFLCVFQIMQAFFVLQLPERIREVTAFPPVLQLILALVWGLLFAVALVTLAKSKPGALRYTQLLVIVFVLYSLLRQVVFAQSDYDRSRLSFFAGITFCLLTVPIITLLRHWWRSVYDERGH
jgi:hypothetical protein